MRACIKVDLWQKIEGAVRTKGSRARQARNALLPIQRLPTEVALQLFDTVLMPIRRRHYYDILKGVSEVCHHWRKIIHHTPALWSKIYCTAVRSEVVDQALERSTTHPLDVWFSSMGGGNKIGLESFLEKLSPHMGRCQRLALTYFEKWDRSEGLAELVRLPAPKLEQVVLEDQRWLSNLEGVELFGGQAAMLKEVEVLGIACNWECGAFKGLSVISLSRVSFPSIDRLLGILGQSRRLSRLQLSFITFTEDAATVARSITFPLLDNFSLLFEDVRHTEVIMDHINAPICSHLCFLLPDEVDIQGKVMHLAAKWLARRQAPVPNLQSAAFALAYSRVTLSAVSAACLEALSLTLRCSPGEENTACLLNAANCVAKELLCAVESSFKVDERAIDLLEHPRIVEGLRQLLPVTAIDIGDPFADGEGGRYWAHPRQFALPPFPSLRVFRTFHQPMECIFSVLKGIFSTPIPNTEDRAVHVEIHGQTHPKPDWLDYISTQTKEIVGENCRSSFVFTPRLSNVGD